MSGGDRTVRHRFDQLRQIGIDPHRLALLDQVRIARASVCRADTSAGNVPLSIRHLLGAGLSSEDIAYLLPCAVGETPDLLGCPELLAAMRSRLRRLDDQMDRIAQSRDALTSYIAAAERMSGESYPPFDDAGLKPSPPERGCC